MKFATLIMLALLAQAAAASEPSRDLPIHIKGGTFKYEPVKEGPGKIVFSKGVEVKQGTAEASAERLTALLGIAPGARIEAGHVSALLSHPRGALQGVGKARVIPLINMVDDPQLHVLARDIAHAALAQSERISTIVLASMKAARIVEIVTRDNLPDSAGYAR